MSLGELIDACTKDALPRFTKDDFPDDVQVYSWPQTWGDTTCGFPGIGGQMISEAQCVVVTYAHAEYAVYHDGRFAYLIPHASDVFWEDFASHRLVGVRENWGKYIKREGNADATAGTN